MHLACQHISNTSSKTCFDLTFFNYQSHLLWSIFSLKQCHNLEKPNEYEYFKIKKHHEYGYSRIEELYEY